MIILIKKTYFAVKNGVIDASVEAVDKDQFDNVIECDIDYNEDNTARIGFIADPADFNYERVNIQQLPVDGSGDKAFFDNITEGFTGFAGDFTFK